MKYLRESVNIFFYKTIFWNVTPYILTELHLRFKDHTLSGLKNNPKEQAERI